jgi:pseudaminic acid biosynthesis-associated methylase
MSEVIDFWKGDFGRMYTERNRPDWHKRVPFWERIYERTGATTYLDVGTNAGWNMEALMSLNEGIRVSGVDVNPIAVEEAKAKGLDVFEWPAHELGALFAPGSAEVSITSGVLIHVEPDNLLATMCAIRDVSSKYVVAIEYSADEETEVEYRGHTGRLWKRPYGRLYEKLGMSVLEYGPAEGFDHCDFWLLEKA